MTNATMHEDDLTLRVFPNAGLISHAGRELVPGADTAVLFSLSDPYVVTTPSMSRI
jgi:hypothetical protein